MITKINKIISGGLLCCAVAVALTACTDAWDDHYESLGSGEGGVHEGTLWQAISSNPNLSNFAKVVEGCNYVDKLNGSQVFTVFVPTNDHFTEAEADKLISEYNDQKGKVLEENNTVLKEFLQNHMMLYNRSFTNLRNDTLVMMNGKYAFINPDSTVNGVKMSAVNQLYGNGVLNIVDSPVTFFPNVFEAYRKDADYDSLYSFLYNEHYYFKEFQAWQSVAGSIVNGKTQYLDSVFKQINQWYDYVGLINSEDSNYIMVAPTNKVCEDLVKEYEPYFDYSNKSLDKKISDSLQYKMSRLAIMRGTTFSRTFNNETSLQDSAMSVNCTRNYTQRKSRYHGIPMEYYQYYMPLAAKGALNQTEIMKCSNGEVRKASEWNIDKRQTFHQFIIANGSNYHKVDSITDPSGKTTEDVPKASKSNISVSSNNKAFYDKLWDHSIQEVSPNYTTLAYNVYYTLYNVLSNVGYDIYLVTAPALAADTTASAELRRPTKFSCKMYGPGLSSSGEKLNPPSGGKYFETRPDTIDYFLVASNYKFKMCTQGMDNENLQYDLMITTSNTSTNDMVPDPDRPDKKLYTRTLRINAILVVPHGSLELVDELPATIGTGNKAITIPASAQGTPGIIMYPHRAYDDEAGAFKTDAGDYKAWYMQR